MTPQNKHKKEENVERDEEFTAANIVYQIGDALYDALPPDIAHEHFVKARQDTNDTCIPFAEKLIRKQTNIAYSEGFKAGVLECKNKIQTDCLDYCMVQNGRDDCKNCGLDANIFDSLSKEEEGVCDHPMGYTKDGYDICGKCGAKVGGNGIKNNSAVLSNNPQDE